MRCAISYHLYNLKNVKNTHGGVLILLKLQAKARNFTKINTPPWVFFTLFKLCKWYQIAQRTTFWKSKTLLLLKLTLTCVLDFTKILTDPFFTNTPAHFAFFKILRQMTLYNVSACPHDGNMDLRRTILLKLYVVLRPDSL